MATYPTGEDLFIKTRKPYTITKQRERWTEDEHNRFLDALKLYGRAWQRIEEHIGTKTAVQIRSHAQKFFSKLEKEAHARGVPLGQTLNIEIPPPRPKRKPSNPYPRNSSTNAPTTSSIVSEDGKPLTSASSLQHGEQILHFKNDLHPEKHYGNEKSARADEPPEDENCSEVVTFFKEPPCTSMSSANQSSIPKSVVLENSCPVMESLPLLENISNQGTKDESDLSMESKENQKSDGTEAHYADLDFGTSKTPDLENYCCKSDERSLHEEISDELKQPERFCPLPIDEMQSNRNHPKHVPIIGGNTETCIPNQSPNKYPSSIIYQEGGSHGNPNFFTDQITEQQSNSSMPFGHQSSPNLAPPFAPYLHYQDTYSSLLNISSTFPNLIISALLQNPTAHMAASLAASFWPCTNVESVESPAGALGGFPFRPMNPSPNLAALAAATVAAASAWWTTHGVLPFCPPLHTGFTCPAASMAVASVETGQVPVVNRGKESRPLDPPWEGQQLDPEFVKSLKLQNSASKLPTSPSSDSEESGVRRSNSNELSTAVQEEEPAPIDGQGDSNKVKTRKKAGRSSCGSNTPSSSEVETNALENTESKEPDVIHLSSEPNNRRNRTPANSNDQSWKEVSEEGRLAFQALFSREVLPQSFSPPHDPRDKDQHKNSVEGKQKSNKIDDENGLQLDLNRKTWDGKTWDVSPNHPCSDKSDLSSSKSSEIGLLSIGLGQGKLRNRRTGFKPYKRCSMEVKESRIPNGSSQVEENDPKRIRLEAGALT